MTLKRSIAGLPTNSETGIKGGTGRPGGSLRRGISLSKEARSLPAQRLLSFSLRRLGASLRRGLFPLLKEARGLSAQRGTSPP